MTPEIKNRIEQIRRGEVPNSFQKTKLGIIPYDWNICAIDDCLMRVEHPVNVQPNEMYTQVGIRSHGKGLFHKNPVSGQSLGNKSVFWIKPDCFILNIVFAWEQAIGKTSQAENGMIGSHRFPMYRPINKNIDIDYLITYLMTKRGKNVLEAASPGGAGRNKTLGQDRFMKSKIVLPPFTEQQKIAEILSTQDKLIALKEKLIEELKKKKQFYLTKMFPKKGETVPEIRFKEFIDDWEQRKVSDLADFSKGSGYSKGDLKEIGTPIILYGRLYTKYQFEIGEVDTFADIKTGSVFSKGDEVIVPASGETAEDIARAAAVVKPGFLLGGDLNILHPFTFMNPSFVALSISNGQPQKELAKKAQGKSVVHIHNSDIQEVTISYPDKDEQDKIVSYFSQLDNLITLHQCELEQEKQKKKALMQLLLTGIVRTNQ